jgi:pimeloyl-ACP methyl ester carboxylesterase
MSLANEPGPLDSEAYRRVCAERPGHFERGIETTRLASSAMFAAMLEEMAYAPSRLEALTGLEVPTLVLVGEQDTPFIDASVALAGAIPGARLEILSDAGHSPQFEAPKAWWDAVLSFLGPAHQVP